MRELRPSATGERVRPGERELPYEPVEWSRRLDQARQARAKILEARESRRPPQRREAPYRLQEPVAAPRGPTPGAGDPAAAVAEPPVRAGAVRRRFRVIAGFTLGVSVGTVLAFLLLFGTWGPAAVGPTASGPADPGAAAAE